MTADASAMAKPITLNRWGVDTSTFKVPGRKRKTVALFVETTPDEDTTAVPYSLNDGVPGKPSLHSIYMEVADPTEYYFAIEAFGSWDLWKAIQSTQWMKNYITEWREELSNKLQSDAMKRFAHMAVKGDAAAARWFAERSWEKQIPHLKENAGRPRGGKRGRPSDEERSAALRSAVASDKAELDTLRRLGLLDGEG